MIYKTAPTTYQFSGPPLVADILEAEQLVASEIYRNGPRYWVGRVGRGGEAYILKVVIDDTPWFDPEDGQTFRPSDQLKTEIYALEALSLHHADVAGGSPRIIARSFEGGPVWALRAVVEGQSMAAHGSPFVYRPEIYDHVLTAKVIDYIESYQQLTPRLTGHLHLTSRSTQRRAVLQSKMRMLDLDNPTELLNPYAPAIREFLWQRRELHDLNSNTFTHGEVFPPHIYLHNGIISMIDWENAGLNNKMNDFVAAWIRGFHDSKWQDGFIGQLVRRGILQSDIDGQLWNMEVLMQASGNLNYLYWSKYESAAEKSLAVASLRRKIEDILKY